MDSALAPRVAENVAQIMASKDLNLHAVAQASNIPRNTLRRRLAGQSSFTVAEVECLAEALGVAVADLIGSTAA